MGQFIILKGEECDIKAVCVDLCYFKDILELIPHFLELIDRLLFHNWIMKFI